MEYVFTRDVSKPVLDVRELHDTLESRLPGVVESVTIAGHTIPRTVFVRCRRTLTAEERTQFSALITN